MNKKVDTILGIGLILFGLIGIFYIVPNYVDKPQFGFMAELPADMYPKIIMGTIVILGIVLFLQSLFRTKTEEKNTMLPEHKKRALIAIVIMIVFLISIEIIGYYLACALFLPFTMFYLGERKIWILGVVTFTFLGVNYLFFEKSLNIILPRGILF